MSSGEPVDAVNLASALWAGHVPVLFTLFPAENIRSEKPPKHFALLSRRSYFYQLQAELTRIFSPFVADFGDEPELWLEATVRVGGTQPVSGGASTSEAGSAGRSVTSMSVGGISATTTTTSIPVQWHLPVSAIVDQLTIMALDLCSSTPCSAEVEEALQLPVEVCVHFTPRPTSIIPLRTPKECELMFMHQVKSATALVCGDALPVINLTPPEQQTLVDCSASCLAGSDKSSLHTTTTTGAAAAGGTSFGSCIAANNCDGPTHLPTITSNFSAVVGKILGDRKPIVPSGASSGSAVLGVPIMIHRPLFAGWGAGKDAAGAASQPQSTTSPLFASKAATVDASMPVSEIGRWVGAVVTSKHNSTTTKEETSSCERVVLCEGMNISELAAGAGAGVTMEQLYLRCCANDLYLHLSCCGVC